MTGRNARAGDITGMISSDSSRAVQVALAGIANPSRQAPRVSLRRQVAMPARKPLAA